MQAPAKNLQLASACALSKPHYSAHDRSEDRACEALTSANSGFAGSVGVNFVLAGTQLYLHHAVKACWWL